MSKDNKLLAINGGKPVTEKPVLLLEPYIREDDVEMVASTVRSPFVSGNGPTCRKFEKALAEYLGVKHVLFTNSATAALEMAYRIMDFPAGSEVIVPDFTYTSTALAPLYNNLKVVLADVDPLTGNIDIDKLESYITESTVAISPVDYAGNPVEMDKVEQIAKKHNLFVVHDSAQSLGSEYKGVKTGNFGDVSCLSFHATKNLITGEGGAFVTNNSDLAEKAMLVREKGTDKQRFLNNNIQRGYYEYIGVGNSYVNSDINAALGLSQLSKLDWMNQNRREIMSFYAENLKDVKGLSLPVYTENTIQNGHIYCIHVPEADKLWILDALKAENVYTNVHFSPLHSNHLYSDLGTDEDFPGAVQFFSGLLRLPLYPGLTHEALEHVITAVKKVMGSLN